MRKLNNTLDDIDPAAIREELARNGIVNGEVVDPEALARNPFIQQVEADVAAIAAEEASADEQEPQAEPDTVPRNGSQRIPAEAGSPRDQRADPADEEPNKQRESNGEESARTGFYLRDRDR